MCTCHVQLIKAFCGKLTFRFSKPVKPRVAKIVLPFSTPTSKKVNVKKRGAVQVNRALRGEVTFWVRSEGDKKRREREKTEGTRVERTRLSAETLEGGKSRKQDKRKAEMDKIKKEK